MSTVQSISFFFQAEDGIRDHCVTGVQTCALPIFVSRTVAAHGDDRSQLHGRRSRRSAARNGLQEIGRASCRERVYILLIVVVEMRDIKRKHVYSRVNSYDMK